MSKPDEYLLLLLALDDESIWSIETLQLAIREIQDLVNSASDITGILTSGLIADYWGDMPIITYWVQHDYRYEDLGTIDDMVRATFEKAIELSGYQDDMWVLDSDERDSLETE